MVSRRRWPASGRGNSFGGTAHLALGTAYPESGGLNRSALHWDLICDLRSGSEVYADGELVYRDGHFLNGTNGWSD